MRLSPATGARAGAFRVAHRSTINTEDLYYLWNSI